jgi:protein phosphatase
MSPAAPTSFYTRTASLTDVGSVRSANQDCCGEFVDDHGYRLLIVADGMGGHRGGEVASQTTVDAVGETFQRGVREPEALLREAFVLANKRVYERAARDPDLYGMGTTGVALLIGPARTAWIAHVGDSRAYRSRGGGLDLLTRDHSWVLEEVRHNRLTPEEAANHPRKNVLTRSIGVDPTLEVDVSTTDLQPGDRFLLCSDGLWGEVTDDTLGRVLAGEEPDRAVRTLVDLANQHGGPDNITVQIAELPSRIAAGDSASAPPPDDADSTQETEALASDDAETTLPLAAPADVRGRTAGEGGHAADVERAAQRRRARLLTAAVAAVAGLLALALLWLVADVRVEPAGPAITTRDAPASP